MSRLLPDDGAPPDPLELIRILRRHWQLISAVAVAIALTALFVIAQLEPYYEATSSVVINRPNEEVSDAATIFASLSGDADTIETEIQVIMSRNLAAQVVEHLNLAAHPEYSQLENMVGSLGRALDWLRRLHNDLTGMIADQGEAAAVATFDELKQVRLVSQFLANLSVEREGLSRVIDIRFVAKDPVLAKDAANSLAHYYMAEKLNAKRQAGEAAHEWLSARIERLSQTIWESEAELARLQKERGIVKGERAELVAEQLSEVSQQLLVTRLERSDAESRYDNMRRVLESGNLASSELVDNPEIRSLRDSGLDIRRTIASLSATFGEQHPHRIAAQAQLYDVQAQLQDKMREIASDLERQLNSIRERERSLEREVKHLTEASQAVKGAEVEFRALEREAEASRQMLQLFLNRAQAVDAGEEFPIPQVSIVSSADIPEKPAGPNKLLYGVAAAAFGLIGGIVLAFLRELSDSTLRSGDEVERELGVPCFGVIPLATSRGSAITLATDEPRSAVADATRRMGTLLRNYGPEISKRVITITSAMPGEGKSTTAAAYARLAAAEGCRVILMDGDFRQPSLHKLLRIRRTPGLANYLSGDALLNEVFHRDDHFGLHVIPAGNTGGRCVDICCYQREMHRLVLSLRQHYDLVIIDTSPVFAVQDTLILANLSDVVIVAGRWGVTNKKEIESAVHQIQKCGSRLVGVVVTMVDTQKSAKYNFGDSAQYVPRLSRYYR